MSDEIKIMSFDPSINFIGCTIMTCIIEPETDKLIVRSIETTLLDMTVPQNPHNINGTQIFKLEIIDEKVTELLEAHKPDIVSYERPFLSRFSPGAYGPLVQCCNIIIMTTLTYDGSTLIFGHSPGEVKNALGAKGGKTKKENGQKITVMESALKCEHVTNFVNPEKMTEHELDSVGVAYCSHKYIDDRRELLW